MVGPGGDWLKHTYEEAAVLFGESDGCRVVTRSRHELLRRVPEPLVHVFAIGSTAPAALLFDALDSFDKASAKADETLRLVGPEMLAAVSECISAAGHEFEPQTQKQLLRAAAFGAPTRDRAARACALARRPETGLLRRTPTRSRVLSVAARKSHSSSAAALPALPGHVYCPLDNRLPHHVFPGMCRTLRLLNALRERDQGHMPVSFSQFQGMQPALILQRLVNAKRYLLAMRISEFLGESPHSIVLQWASAKMAASLQLSDRRAAGGGCGSSFVRVPFPSSRRALTHTGWPAPCARVRCTVSARRQLLDTLMEKLSQVPGLPFTQVAADAYSRGRPRLAAMLLDYETRSSEQVPLLTSMGEDERALQKAVESGARPRPHTSPLQRPALPPTRPSVSLCLLSFPPTFPSSSTHFLLGDMDLVYLAVFNMYRKVPEFSAFAEVVNKHKVARDLFVAFTRKTDPDLLKSFLFATGDTEGTADAVYHDAIYGPRGAPLGLGAVLPASRSAAPPPLR